METIISSTVTEVVIGGEHPTVLIGERINPSGKKALADSLKTGNLELVRQEALTQVQAGADIIDVNVGTFGVDEVTMKKELYLLDFQKWWAHRLLRGNILSPYPEPVAPPWLLSLEVA